MCDCTACGFSSRSASYREESGAVHIPILKIGLTDAYFLFYKPFGCCRHDRVKSLTMLIEALPYSITCGHSITCGPNISSSPTLLR